MVEFALILPLLALFLVIAIDFGRVFYTYVQLNNSAREAAAFGASAPNNTALIQGRALQEKNTQGQRDETGMQVAAPVCKDTVGAVIACSAATGGAGPGNTMTVSVSERFSFITPFVNSFFNDNFVMSASSTSTVLGYAPSGAGSPPGACSLPVPSFTVVVTSGLTVHVDPAASTPDSGVCNISGFNWTWGDGNTDVGQATGDDHTYLSPGPYTIILEATNQAGAATTSRLVTVPAGPPAPTCTPPVANFTTAASGKERTYTDASTVADPINCPITGWLWTFHDFNPDTTSNAQNPATQTYQTGNSGTSHPVTLAVTNAAGTTTIMKGN